MFLRTPVADPRFADAVNDIVIEVANARYQEAMDRYIRGDQIPIEAVRPAWQNTTVPNQIGRRGAVRVHPQSQCFASEGTAAARAAG